MKKKFSFRSLFLALGLASIVGGAANAQQANQPATQPFYYDPELTGTVRASYHQKSGRYAALLFQPHTKPYTACGLVFQGLKGKPISNLTVTVDL
ncbi:MAG: hypothetical protein K2Z81_11565, partial [Cyanobacteria bacterium]|nr:hypothetical protein [Cyanobacteriota bacterium]